MFLNKGERDKKKIWKKIKEKNMSENKEIEIKIK